MQMQCVFTKRVTPAPTLITSFIFMALFIASLNTLTATYLNRNHWQAWELCVYLRSFIQDECQTVKRLSTTDACCLDPWVAAKKRYHLLQFGLLANGHLLRLSRQSCLSLMRRVVIRWYRGLCTDLLAFTLRLKKTPETLIKESSSHKGSITSKWNPNKLYYL